MSEQDQDKACKNCSYFTGEKCSKHDFEQITPDMEVCADFHEKQAMFSQSPWRIVGNHIVSSEVNCFGGNTTVCRIHEQYSESKEIANAHLIVYAPKMYEKLQELYDDLIALANDCLFKNYDDRGDFWEQKANDIAEFLQQARGEE